MYCKLCRVVAPPSHENSSWHRSAKELAAVAVDRLSEHLIANEKDDAPISVESVDDFLKVKIPSPTSKSKTENLSKTEVFYCDTCNVTMPVNELKNHHRLKSHTLATYTEQTLEELAAQYVNGEHRWLMQGMREPQAAVDDTEAVKTYTCNLCALDVPVVFKMTHDLGARHLTCRAVSVAAAKRARDVLRDSGAPDKADTSEDKSDEKPEDGSGDKSGDKPKFTGKMMRKLLKLYAGKVVDKDAVENTAGEPADAKIVKRLSPRQYFTEMLPHLSYVATSHTVIIDDTEYVTVQIGRDTLRLHMNTYSGIQHYNRQGTCYMTCKLCTFDYGPYVCGGELDKQHVMSLGHIKHVMSSVENVHMIRKIDDNVAVCVLCNMRIARSFVDEHICEAEHSAALTEALERGKAYKHNNNHLKFMIYNPQGKKIRWYIGPPRFSCPFFGPSTAYNSSACVLKANYGGQSSGYAVPNFVYAPQNSTYASQSSAYAPQNFTYAPQNCTYVPQNSADYANQNSAGYATQNSAGYAPQNCTYAPQNSAGYANQNSAGYATQNSAGYAMQNSAGYAPQNSAGYAPQNSGYSNQNSAGYANQNSAGYAPQNSAGYAMQNSAGYVTQNSAGYATQNSAGYATQNSDYATQNAGYATQSSGYGAQNAVGVKSGATYSAAPAASYGGAQNDGSPQTASATGGARNSAPQNARSGNQDGSDNDGVFGNPNTAVANVPARSASAYNVDTSPQQIANEKIPDIQSSDVPKKTDINETLTCNLNASQSVYKIGDEKKAYAQKFDGHDKEIIRLLMSNYSSSSSDTE